MLKTLLLPGFLIFFSSCFTTRPERPIVTDTPKNNEDYRVDYLFEHDGCRVYRFYDRGNYVYFTNCTNQAVMVTDSSQVINSIRHNR